MRTTALLPPPVVATMVQASRPGLNRLLASASKVPAGTRTRQVRQTIRTLDYPSRSEQVRGEWVIGGRSGVGHVRPDQPIIYYLHGSGYVVCSTRTHRGLTARRNGGLTRLSQQIGLLEHGLTTHLLMTAITLHRGEMPKGHR